MSDLHCWEDGPRELGEPGTTCMLEAGHPGPHEWTRDDQILVSFPAIEEGRRVMGQKLTPKFHQEQILILRAQLREAQEDAANRESLLTQTTEAMEEFASQRNKAIGRAEAAEALLARHHRQKAFPTSEKCVVCGVDLTPTEALARRGE